MAILAIHYNLLPAAQPGGAWTAPKSLRASESNILSLKSNILSLILKSITAICRALPEVLLKDFG